MPKWLSVTLLFIVGLILLILVVTSIANMLFNQKVKKEIGLILNDSAEKKTEIVRKEDLSGLPEPVQKWLINANIIGKEKIKTVRLKQKGLMRTTPDGPWMTTEAEQYFRVDEPGFVWKANVKMAPFLHFAGVDKFIEGKGHMNIKIASLLSVVNAQGPEVDESTLLRYLAEICWFPTAALNNYIKWEPIDSNSARATMTYKGVTGSGVFVFNEKGDVVSITANRFMETNGKYVKEQWGGVNKGYKEFNGIRIPYQTDIIWYLKTGNFDWFQLEVTDIEYNRPLMY